MSSSAPTSRIDAAREAAVWCLRLSEGPLSEADQAQFDAWLAADVDHVGLLDEAVLTWRDLEDAGTAAEFLPLRMEALDAARRRGRPKAFWRTIPRPVAIAAGLLLMVGAGAGVVWRLQAPVLYETGIGEREIVRLTDGSRLSLDADTRVRVKYRRDRRELSLERGRAKFDVAKNPLRPFSVTAADKVVVATGTAFSVELVQREVRVVLYEGHVAVLAHQTAPQAPQRLQSVRLASTPGPADQVLAPGRELVTRVASASAVVTPTNSAQAISWEAGQLVFVDEPLSTAVERVNRYADTKLAVGDDRAARVLVTGVFTAGDTQAFVEGVTVAYPLRSDLENGMRVLRSKLG